ncbi:TPA: hypothetical protein ACJIW3_005121 [Enterobacter hormaechei]
MEFYENRSKRPFIAFVWVAKTLRNWYRINRTRRILSELIKFLIISKSISAVTDQDRGLHFW